jgi:hypothetical protein
MSTTAQRYHAPSVEVDSEPVTVSLTEFSVAEIRGYLEHIEGGRGTTGTARLEDGGLGSIRISGQEASQIEMLHICGQKQEARDYLCRIVGDQIGRAL